MVMAKNTTNDKKGNIFCNVFLDAHVKTKTVQPDSWMNSSWESLWFIWIDTSEPVLLNTAEE